MTYGIINSATALFNVTNEGNKSTAEQEYINEFSRTLKLDDKEARKLYFWCKCIIDREEKHKIKDQRTEAFRNLFSKELDMLINQKGIIIVDSSAMPSSCTTNPDASDSDVSPDPTVASSEPSLSTLIQYVKGAAKLATSYLLFASKEQIDFKQVKEPKDLEQTKAAETTDKGYFPRTNTRVVI